MSSHRSLRLGRLGLAFALAGLVSACGGEGETTSPEPSSIVKLAGDEQAGRIGSELADPLVVQILDAANRPIAGLTITWVVENGAGSVSPGLSATDADGMASTHWTLGSVGINTVNAVASGVGAVSFSASALTSEPES